jgi:glycosyltransferase involved in cell wall biosynthesis
MNIRLVVHHELQPDAGAPGSVVQLCKAYREAGHEARIYSHSDLPARLSPRAKQFVFPAFVAHHLRREVRRSHVDVVDASPADTWLWTVLDRARRRVLLVARSHGLEHTASASLLDSAAAGLVELSWKYRLYYGGFHLWEVARTLRAADLVFVLNRSDLEYAVERLNVDRPRIRVVFNGIRPGLEEVAFEKSPDTHSGEIGIAHVGTYLPQKGLAYSVPALSAVLRTFPRVRATMLGTGADRETVLGAFDADVRSRVRVIPRYENDMLPTLLSGHQIVVSATLSEGFGTSILEAMACGLAPVSTATPGPSEFIRHEGNGLLVQPRSADALEAALGRLIADGALLDRLRRAAKASAAGYTWRASAAERLDAYRVALSARTGS